MTKEKDDLIDESNIPKSDWFLFENIGDSVGGTLIDIQDRPAKGMYPPQRVFTLRKKTGETARVGIPLKKDYVIGRANTAKLGDELGFKFIKEIPPTIKGFSPAKSIEVYVRHINTVANEDDGMAGY